MLAMVSIKWRGTNKEREEIDAWYKKIADKTKGLEYKGLYSSWQSDYNWAYLYNAKDVGAFEKAMMSEPFERDYSKLPAVTVEFWGGPF
jgi:hypothetical protein